MEPGGRAVGALGAGVTQQNLQSLALLSERCFLGWGSQFWSSPTGMTCSHSIRRGVCRSFLSIQAWDNSNTNNGQFMHAFAKNWGGGLHYHVILLETTLLQTPKNYWNRRG